MAARISLDEFFEGLRAQGGYPVIDSVEVREAMLRKLDHIARHYPNKSSWPVADIELAYEQYLNNSQDLAKYVREFSYLGTVNLRGYDETYSMNEWFDDFRIEYKLVDTPEVRKQMLFYLPGGETWPPSKLYQAHAAATAPPKNSFLRRLFG